ncbi:spore gernimation protein [Priestia megaterium]|uniref:GerAB/ArcD/ProY family transporter n=1 Tax=Priestia megaterium TaxID=1404 RepID=UPI0006809856|nr:endospore germination permease [Priestia megaterium]KNH16495.1 spore gernimation protein [Priestia megaterium]
MHSQMKLSAAQFRILVIFYSLGDTILVVPGSLTADSKQEAWIPAILGVGVGVLLVWMYIKLSSLYPNKTLIELNEAILGKWLGKFVSLLFVASTLLFCSQVLFYVGSFLTTRIIIQTPMLAVHILFMGIVIVGVRLGIETIARCAEILFPWFVIPFLILVFSIFPQIHYENLQPLLEVGVKPIIRSILVFTSITSLTFIVLLTVFPAHVAEPDQRNRAFFTGSLIGGGIMIIILLLGILVLGNTYTRIALYPSYELARRIEVADFLKNIEVIMAIMWFLSLYFKTSLYYYATVSGLAQILELKNYRILTLPLGIIAVTFSLIVYPSIPYEQTWDRDTWIPYSLLFGLFYPLGLLIVWKIRVKHSASLSK